MTTGKEWTSNKARHSVLFLAFVSRWKAGATEWLFPHVVTIAQQLNNQRNMLSPMHVAGQTEWTRKKASVLLCCLYTSTYTRGEKLPQLVSQPMKVTIISKVLNSQRKVPLLLLARASMLVRLPNRSHICAMGLYPERLKRFETRGSNHPVRSHVKESRTCRHNVTTV